MLVCDRLFRPFIQLQRLREWHLIGQSAGALARSARGLRVARSRLCVHGDSRKSIVRIMSLNAWGGTLGDVLLPYLHAEQPDIICLQEIPHSPETTKTWLEYRDGNHILPQRTN